MSRDNGVTSADQDAFLKGYLEITGMDRDFAIAALADENCTTVAGRNIHTALLVWQAAIEQVKVTPIQFPVMLRKMWSGGEVQEWLNENHAISNAQQSAPLEQTNAEHGANFDYETILKKAEFSHKSYAMGIRGQTMTERDCLEWHVAEAAWEAAIKANEQRIQALEKLNASLQAEIANLHTVMMAAAVEITEHWDAHCDEDGCGPTNLVNRLENGFPEQYGYDAKTVVRMEKQIEDLRSQAHVEQLELICHQRQDANGKWAHVEAEDIAHYQDKGQPIRALYAKASETAQDKPAFSVHVEKMEESHRTTYWVRLVNEKLRPADVKIYDNTGQIHPYYSEELERVESTAQEWAEFLGVDVTVNLTSNEKQGTTQNE